MQGDGFTILHCDEFEQTGRWSLARRSLGASSFGMNMVEMEPGYSIPEHNETGRDHEEVYIVWRGNVTAVVDGQDYPAPVGTFIRLDPHPRRTLRNDGDETAVVLMVSAPRTSGFAPLDWA